MCAELPRGLEDLPGVNALQRLELGAQYQQKLGDENEISRLTRVKLVDLE
jgi:hypothetical protein